MSKINLILDNIVLYYKRKETIKPIEPSFNNIREENPDYTMDNLLDKYSELKKKHKEDLIVYEKTKTDNIVEGTIIIPEDDFLVENIRKFERNEFFIDWNENSKRLINDVIG